MEYKSLKSFKTEFCAQAEGMYGYNYIRALGRSAGGKAYALVGGFAWHGNQGGFERRYIPLSEAEYIERAKAWEAGEPDPMSLDW